jgi:heme-degrading monooxygenase HmoA
MGYSVIWTYRVEPNRRREFETAYGPKGAWAALFARADAFVDLDLLRSIGDDGRYVTIDRWTSQRAYESFKAEFAVEYNSLDEQLEGIAATETYIGAFAG